MADEWLDKKALDIINKPPSRSFDEPILVSSSDESDQIQSVQRIYDKSRIQIQLPNSKQIEELQYIPPTLPPKKFGENNTNDPHFISPKEHFDIFEHFNFTWIEAPELEKDT